MIYGGIKAKPHFLQGLLLQEFSSSLTVDHTLAISEQ